MVMETLGPEPLEAEFTPQVLRARAGEAQRRRSSPCCSTRRCSPAWATSTPTKRCTTRRSTRCAPRTSSSRTTGCGSTPASSRRCAWASTARGSSLGTTLRDHINVDGAAGPEPGDRAGVRPRGRALLHVRHRHAADQGRRPQQRLLSDCQPAPRGGVALECDAAGQKRESRDCTPGPRSSRAPPSYRVDDVDARVRSGSDSTPLDFPNPRATLTAMAEIPPSKSLCRDCGRPLSFHAGETAPARCAACFDSFMQVRDSDFLTSYAELGVTSRRIVAETLPARARDGVAARPQGAGDADHGAVRPRGGRPHRPLQRAASARPRARHARVPRRSSSTVASAMAFVQEMATTPQTEIMASLGLPMPDDVARRFPSLSKGDVRDLKRAMMQMLGDMKRIGDMGESVELALAQAAGEQRSGPRSPSSRRGSTTSACARIRSPRSPSTRSDARSASTRSRWTRSGS